MTGVQTCALPISEKLIESLGGIVVKMVFLIELSDLKGRERLSKYDVASVVKFEGE